MSAEQRTWQPLTRAGFRQLRRGDRIADRGGRVWTVHAVPQHVDGLEPVVLRSGDHVRRVREGWADDYRLLAAAGDAI
jgi:hypothetical protein